MDSLSIETTFSIILGCTKLTIKVIGQGLLRSGPEWWSQGTDEERWPWVL